MRMRSATARGQAAALVLLGAGGPALFGMTGTATRSEPLPSIHRRESPPRPRLSRPLSERIRPHAEDVDPLAAFLGSLNEDYN